MKSMLGIAGSILLLAAAFGPVTPTPPKPSIPTFSTRASNDSIYATISWKQSIDSAGPADYYIADASFMSKTIPGFPKKVTGLSTTITVPEIAWGTSGVFIADLRAVRRGLTSLAVSGRATYTRTDKGPPPPTGVVVLPSDSIVYVASIMVLPKGITASAGTQTQLCAYLVFNDSTRAIPGSQKNIAQCQTTYNTFTTAQKNINNRKQAIADTTQLQWNTIIN